VVVGRIAVAVLGLLTKPLKYYIKIATLCNIMAEQVSNSVESVPPKMLFRHLVYSKLQEKGFEPKKLLKSGRALGGGMVKGDIEVIATLDAGIYTISICLPVDARVRGDVRFGRINFGGRSILLHPSHFIQNNLPKDSQELWDFINLCWPEIGQMIGVGEYIISCNKDKVYPDFEEAEPDSLFKGFLARISKVLSGKK